MNQVQSSILCSCARYTTYYKSYRINSSKKLRHELGIPWSGREQCLNDVFVNDLRERGDSVMGDHQFSHRCKNIKCLNVSF